MPGKREDVISWDEFFMRAAVAASLRSKDPNTQVGACISYTKYRNLWVGYTGTPSALHDDDFPWGTADDPLHDKHNYVIHAEANAILNYRGSLKDMAPSALNDDDFPWGTADDPLHDKHNYVIHAEANAILNYRGSLKDMAGATVYVTLFPCHECAKTLVQAGIGEVVYLDDKYCGTEDNLISKNILDRCGITYRQVQLGD